ncbi:MULTISPECIES: hypothetical protein [Streptomyces]|uniref:hypothetical protein n=1 Tax=Streptomyces TaxID=1883 RepID=UPI00136DE72C|nr:MULTISPECIES: hypothetical protein [Streptomyces]NEA06563.1 hypothetical protein [Streptomyces sp. SID10116]MYY85560.1 hypothetical protein [Streptomyces sp. SID335]MYZ15157.1 hypothetical protein [Streptomyces sp. SID337]NDZ90452.1 hypothetical protein [Streptomyces sp. SID10115]NEB49561.1 hypothetical protein [Streptomyces sp. SID339]
MLITPTALSLTMLALFVLAMKASDTAPHRGGTEPGAEPDGPGAPGSSGVPGSSGGIGKGAAG